MLSKNFFYRIKYQFVKKRSLQFFYTFFLTGLSIHLFKIEKKNLNISYHIILKQKNLLVIKKLNAYYWNLIINKNFKEFSISKLGLGKGIVLICLKTILKQKKLFVLIFGINMTMNIENN